MTNQITPNDWEDLSAYLDNQLSARERADLEHRLQRTPELRQALAELDRVRVTLRSQPRLRAPRNFTLTPQMAGIRPGARRGAVMLPSAYPVLRLASLLATLFFIVVSAGSLYVSRYAPAPREVPVSMENQVRQPAEGKGGGGGIVPPQLPPAVAAEAAVTQTEAATGMGGEAFSAGTTQPGVLEVTPLAPEVAAAPTGAADASAQAELPNSALAQPQSGQPLAQAEQPAAQPAEQARPQSWRLAWIILVVVQVLLAILAVASGAAALYMRRSARR